MKVGKGNKIKVLHFIWSANFGGIEKMAIELAFEQNKFSETESSLLIGCRKGEFLELISKYQIPLHFGELKSGYDLSIFKFMNMLKLMKQFDIIHFHTFNLVVMLGAIFSGAKIVYTIHGNFNYGKTVSISDKINNWFKSYFLNRCVDFITFNSNWCKNEAESKFKLTNKSCKVIYNGLPTKENSNLTGDSKSEISKIPADKFIVGTISRFNKSKRIERLIESFAAFSKNKNDILLLLVGDGVEMSQLQNLVNEMDISRITHFTGFISETKSIHQLMDVCVFPFENEAFGLVVLESFQLGKPSIVFSDSGGMQEIQGEYFKEDIVHSVDDLTERLNYYYTNRKLSDNDVDLRKKIAAGFSIGIMKGEFLECYKSLA